MSGLVRPVDRAAPTVSVIVPYRDTPAALDRCVEALERGCDGIGYELIVVDNGSRVAPAPGLTILRNDSNRGFAAACNQGAAAASGHYLLFLNSDVTADPASISRLVDVMERDAGLAAVAPLQRDPRGRTSWPGRAWLSPVAQALALLGCVRSRAPIVASDRPVTDVPWVSAAALLVRARAFRLLGGFDESYFFYEEDEDLGWRFARRGRRVATCRDATVAHHGGLTVEAAGSWPVLSLYCGQARFVRRRCGAGGEWLYRASTFAAIAAKGVRGRLLGRPAPALARAAPPRVLRLLCSRRMQPRIAEE